MTELREELGIVKDAITSLMKTSIIIRDATPRDRFVKANTSPKHPFLSSFDIAHVGHKFPKLESEGRGWLKERLGKAITQRRQYLTYCREHNQKFRERNHGREALPTTLPQQTAIQPIENYGNRAGTVKSLPVSDFAPTDASTLQASLLEPANHTNSEALEEISDCRSQTSFATSVPDDQIGNTLSPPRLKDVATIFPLECPFCWSIQPIRQERQWR